jgi:hypothetical protein
MFLVALKVYILLHFIYTRIKLDFVVNLKREETTSDKVETENCIQAFRPQKSWFLDFLDAVMHCIWLFTWKAWYTFYFISHSSIERLYTIDVLYWKRNPIGLSISKSKVSMETKISTQYTFQLYNPWVDWTKNVKKRKKKLYNRREKRAKTHELNNECNALKIDKYYFENRTRYKITSLYLSSCCLQIYIAFIYCLKKFIIFFKFCYNIFYSSSQWQ